MTASEKKRLAKDLSGKLENKGFEVLYGGSKGHGFWIKGVINSRTKTTWHSWKESQALAG